MNVQPATLSDVERCADLDASYATQRVWQIEERFAPDDTTVCLRRIRIPRHLDVEYPLAHDDLFEHWQRRECFLSAREGGSLVGYLDMTVQRDRWQGWIQHLVVHRPYRHLGIATLLLDAAERWALGSRLDSVTMAVQPKNDPAIALLLGRGYRMRGFLDRHFANGDMALFYCKVL